MLPDFNAPAKTVGITVAVIMLTAFLPRLILPGGGVAFAGEVPARPELITLQAEATVERGLAYLARTQTKDGSWRGMKTCTMTSLAGLALMAGGNTQTEGKYAKSVRRAVDFILRAANRNGLINVGGQGHSMYSHGFSMLFLAQAYGMEPDLEKQRKIRQVLEKAIRLTVRSQSRDGGWLYTPDSNSDEGSVTVTQIQGLRACRNAGIKVPKSTIDRACAYIEKCSNQDGGISYNFRGRGRSLPAITAAAVAVMYNAGRYENKVAVGALEYTKRLLKKHRHDPWQAFGGHAEYGMLYASQAMYLSGKANWREYFPTVRDKLVAMQSKNGEWKKGRRWGGGSIFSSCAALLTLQLPYKYLPIMQR